MKASHNTGARKSHNGAIYGLACRPISATYLAFHEVARHYLARVTNALASLARATVRDLHEA